MRTISKILIVEDNVQSALLMKRILEANHHQILHAEEGSVGYELATQELPDLILVDLGLPDIDGQTLIGVIKNDPKLKDIPVVAVTAWPESTAKAMAMAYGCHGFIAKPINTRTFPSEIQTYLTQA